MPLFLAMPLEFHFVILPDCIPSFLIPLTAYLLLNSYHISALKKMSMFALNHNKRKSLNEFNTLNRYINLKCTFLVFFSNAINVNLIKSLLNY